MSDPTDETLYERTVALLQPGSERLHGAVVHTDHGHDEESLLHQTTLDVGDVVAAHVGADDVYVYSGTDDPEFGVNQHQGLTVADDEFVWECQQLLRDGTFDVVVYWRATDDLADTVADVEKLDGVRDVVGVTEAGARSDAREDQ